MPDDQRPGVRQHRPVPWILVATPPVLRPEQKASIAELLLAWYSPLMEKMTFVDS
jgi:hypothetical protein